MWEAKREESQKNPSSAISKENTDSRAMYGKRGKSFNKTIKDGGDFAQCIAHSLLHLAAQVQLSRILLFFIII